jgi:hypothetical protein
MLQTAFQDVPGLVFEWNAQNPDAQITIDTTSHNSEIAGITGTAHIRSVVDRPFYTDKALSVGNLVVHETGHVLGLLGHSPDPGNYMHSPLMEANQTFSPEQMGTVRAFIADPANSLQHSGGELNFGQ